MNLDANGGARLSIAPNSDDDGGTRGWRSEPLPHAAAAVVVVAQLEAGVALSGRVVDDATGEPIADRRVWLRLAEQDGRSAFSIHADTDADGRFAVGGLDPAGYVAQIDATTWPGGEWITGANGTTARRYPKGWEQPTFTPPAAGVEIRVEDPRLGGG